MFSLLTPELQIGLSCTPDIRFSRRRRPHVFMLVDIYGRVVHACTQLMCELPIKIFQVCEQVQTPSFPSFHLLHAHLQFVYMAQTQTL